MASGDLIAQVGERMLRSSGHHDNRKRLVLPQARASCGTVKGEPYHQDYIEMPVKRAFEEPPWSAQAEAPGTHELVASQSGAAMLRPWQASIRSLYPHRTCTVYDGVITRWGHVR